MIFYQNGYFREQNALREGASIFLAVVLHIAVLFLILHTQSQKTISADILSLPTNVAVRFLTQEKPKDIVEKIAVEKVIEVQEKKPEIVEKKIIAKPFKQEEPKQLNKIEPAAAPQPTPDIRPKITKQNPISTMQPALDIIPVVKEPSIKGRRVQPEYPKRALRLRQEGVVWLHVLINKDGKRQDIKLHKPSQHALLNQAALKAVKKWNFDPNVVNGRPVQSWMEIPIEFRIQ
tara:strand:- start:2339 stop:3037 length:699 start_codon:yes stop_codon:yes gene_type:complete